MIKKFALLVTILLITLKSLAQKIDFVQSDSITFTIHKENVGKIAFMSNNVPIENIKQTDFLKEFEIKDKTDLNIRVFMGNSLTNYLHLISPQLSADELTNNGNYQFTFIVDNKIVFIENLNLGAGNASSKNQKTTFTVPLISSNNEDSWGRFLWDRFFYNGGEDAFSTGTHLLKIEIRPYLKNNEVIVGNLIAEGQLKIIIPEIIFNEEQVKVQNIKPLKELQISNSKIDIQKIEELNRKIAAKTYKDITSIVVLKEGEILLEEYFNGANRATLHDTRSVGKSFASTLLGIAIKDNYIKSETQTLNEFYNLNNYQNYAVAKDSITLKDLLTMSSIFDGSDMNSESAGNEENMYPTKNWIEFTLNLPIDKTKLAQKQWDYFTAGVVVLGDIIDKKVPNGLEKYAHQNLFKPLGISNYRWQFTPQKVVNTAGGVQLRSIDLAKFGQLYKNKGTWNGKQILTKQWVDKSLSHQIKIAEEEYYGYLFWNKTYNVNGKNYEVYYSSGNGGNKIFIFKDQPLVIVITSTAYNTVYGEKQADKIMEQYLIQAIVK